jgi:hypothetical protein
MLTLDNGQIQDFKDIWEKLERKCGYNGGFDMIDMMQATENISFRRQNRVLTGLLASAPTSASTQASGAVAPVWRINSSVGVVCVNDGDMGEIAAQVDGVIGNLDAAPSPILSVGQSVIATLICIKNIGWIPALAYLVGVPAVTGQQVALTDSQILSRVRGAFGGAAYEPTFIKIAKLTLNRTGNTTVTQTQDNTWRDV